MTINLCDLYYHASQFALFFSISIFENVLDQQMLQTKKNAHLLPACIYSITFSNSDNNLVVYKPIVKKLATYTHFQ